MVVGFLEAYCKAVCDKNCPSSTAEPISTTNPITRANPSANKCADGDTVSDDCNSAQRDIVASCVVYVIPFLFLVYY